MRLLVTGGAGFIGSNFVRMSLSTKYEKEISSITVLDALTYAGNLENLASVSNHKKFKFVKGDIRDRELVEKIVSEIDVVINFAAESHVDRSILSARNFVDTNVTGTMNLLEVSTRSKVNLFVQISTDEVYGSIQEGQWDESFPLLPNSPYAASKASADLLCRSFFQTHKLPVIITRCSNNYGPFQFPEKLIPLFITNLVSEKKVPVYGDGLNIREWIHVDDHCEGIWLAIKNGKPGEIYNLSTEVETSNIDITRNILEIMNFGQEKIEWVEDRLGHDQRYALSCLKARKELGFKHKIDFSAGLKSTISWYLDNKEWWIPLKTD